MKRDDVTTKRASAFVEHLVGVQWHVGSVGPWPNSAAARAHLEAVLGHGRLPYPGGPRDLLDPLLDLIQGYLDALRPEGWGTCGTCKHLQPLPNPSLKKCRGLDVSGTFIPGHMPQPFGCSAWTDKDGEAR